jgi:hypothetical protein
MLKRAWYVFATLWALLLLWIIAQDDSVHMSWGLAIVTFGPFAVPLLLGWFFRFVITGSPARVPRAVPYRADGTRAGKVRFGR